jgi:hypothetical protein
MSSRKTVSLIESPIGEIEAEDLEYSTVKEDWNVYDLQDGSRIKVKLSVAKISRGIDPKTGKAYFLPNGEPLYNVRWNVNISAEVPRNILKKLKGV